MMADWYVTWGVGGFACTTGGSSGSPLTIRGDYAVASDTQVVAITQGV